MSAMTISKAARVAGVGVETIRFYQRQGLIPRPPVPPDGGWRVYPAETVARIGFIRQAQELGFSLREIGELLLLRSDPGADCAEVRRRAQAKLEDVESKLERLQAIQSGLRELIAACPGQGALKSCSIVNAFEGVKPTNGAPQPSREDAS